MPNETPRASQVKTAKEKSSPEEVRPAARRAGAPSALVVLVYAATVFFSAFLLFQVQPLISKFILPWFGGSPGVWTTAMLFFQAALCAGYAYVHISNVLFSARLQFWSHIALLLVAGALLILLPWEWFKPTTPNLDPAFQILVLLGATVGAPYFVLSTTGPLLQKWYSDTTNGASPYRLFALSNFGSLLALLSFPFGFEFFWDVRELSIFWSWGFGVFAILCATCAWWTYRARIAASDSIGEDLSPVRSVSPKWKATPQSGIALKSEPAPPKNLDDSPTMSIGAMILWFALPAVASVLSLGVTNEVCQNIAVNPVLWVIPFAIYLLSFILAFDHPFWYWRRGYAALAIPVLLVCVNANWFPERAQEFALYLWGTELDLDGFWGVWRWGSLGLLLLALYLVCMICHCELARLKPHPSQLTLYFLIVSVGGMVGGLFVSLVAPAYFRSFFELPLAIIASLIIAVFTAFTDEGKRLFLNRSSAWAPQISLSFILSVFALVMLPEERSSSRRWVYRGRNFYGLVSVQERSIGESEFHNFTFVSGSVKHGRQYAAAERRHIPIPYWGKGSGSRRLMEYVATRPNVRFGVVGLGVGALAAFMKEGDYCRWYEINPLVREIAENEQFFHYISDCKATQEHVLGDARLQLAIEEPQNFDVLCLDAFSGDSVPTHLLTDEAFAIYMKHLKPNGYIVVNVINRYLNLPPVIEAVAKKHGLKWTRVAIHGGGDLDFATDYMILTNDQEFLDANPIVLDSPGRVSPPREPLLWTDRHSNMFSVLKLWDKPAPKAGNPTSSTTLGNPNSSTADLPMTTPGKSP